MRRNAFMACFLLVAILVFTGMAWAQQGYVTGKGLKVGPTTKTTNFKVDTAGSVTGEPTDVSTTAWSLAASKLTTGIGLSIVSNVLTTGELLSLTADDDALTTGSFYLRMLGGTNHATEVFTVGEGGVTTITPSTAAAAVDALYINGTATTSGDLIALKAVDATLNGGLYINALGGAGSTAVFTVAEDGATAITSTGVATNSLSITNNATTSGDLITLTADDDTLDADTYYISMLGGTDHATAVWSVGEGGQTLITPSAAAITADAIAVAGNALTTGDFISLTADDDLLNGGKYINCIGGASADTAVFTVGEGGVVVASGAITASQGITMASATPASHFINFEGATLASNCNAIRGASVNPVRASGWTSFSGTISTAPAQCYTDYRELHTTSTAEVLGAGFFPYMDSGSSCKSMFGIQTISYVSSGATVLASTGEGDGVFPIWSKLVLDGPITATSGMIAAAGYFDVQSNVTDVQGENVSSLHLHNASGKIKSAVYMHQESGANWNQLLWLNTAAVPFVAGSLKDSAGADIACDAYLKVLVNTTQYYLPLYDTLN